MAIEGTEPVRKTATKLCRATGSLLAHVLTPCLVPFRDSPPGVQGKVHGSLARAGKVKGQTPKVEKQDKPKPPVGTWRHRTEHSLIGPRRDRSS